MNHLTEAGLLLQVLGVIPPMVNALCPSREIHSQEFGTNIEGVDKPGRRDYSATLGGFIFVAVGALLQFLAVRLAR